MIMDVKFEFTNNYILIGGGIQLAEFAKSLIHKKKKVTVFSGKRHANEILPIANIPLSEFLSNLNIKLICPIDINIDPIFLSHSKMNSIALGFGETFKFNKIIINNFKFRLLDVMGIPLPQFRGGAHYSWMIMMENKKSAIHLQEITTNTVQGEFDDGVLIKSKEYFFSESANTPQQYFEEALKHELNFLNDFVDEVDQNVTYQTNTIDENKSLFMPRLHTITNGWVNWHWNGNDICNFINSFSTPYPGSSSLFDEKKVFLKDCELIKCEFNFHPFQSGLIYHINNNAIHVAVSGGALAIKYMGDDKGRINYSSKMLGKRIYTPIKLIEDSMFTQPKYDSNGIL